MNSNEPDNRIRSERIIYLYWRICWIVRAWKHYLTAETISVRGINFLVITDPTVLSIPEQLLWQLPTFHWRGNHPLLGIDHNPSGIQNHRQHDP